MTEAGTKQIAALIAAGGVGSRFATAGNTKHKQRYILNGKPLYIWCLLAFASADRISRIIVVAHSEIVHEIQGEIADALRSHGVSQRIEQVDVIPGGETRQQSVFLGLLHLANQEVQTDYVLVHDAARPLITKSLIDKTIDCVLQHGACTVAAAVSDTIKRVRTGTIIDTVDRCDLYAVHTPQAARFDWLFEGHEDARQKEVAATDDAFILERMGHEVKIVEGGKYNIKVTVPEDLPICEAISKMLDGQING